MANLTLRAVKNSPLTNAEVDGNFSNLNSDKAENDGTGASGTWGISVTGNAATATVLQTARTIGGVSFSGGANIDLPGVNTTGNQDTSGNAATATTAATATNATNVAITDDTASADTHYVHIGDATTGNDGVKVSSTKLTFQPSTGNLVAGGNVTGASDERLKSDWMALSEDFVTKLAGVKCGTYTRVDTGERQIGVSAQSLQPVAPEGVIGDDVLSVAYGNVALAAAVEISKIVVELKAEVQSLKAQLKG